MNPPEIRKELREEVKQEYLDALKRAGMPCQVREDDMDNILNFAFAKIESLLLADRKQVIERLREGMKKYEGYSESCWECGTYEAFDLASKEILKNWREEP